MIEDYSDIDSDDTADEVAGIRRAMQLCQSRSRSLAVTNATSTGDTPPVDDASTSFSLMKKQHEKIVASLEKRCSALEDELNYTKKVLKAKENSLKKESDLIELKVQAIETEYKQHYKDMKKKLILNNEAVKTEASKLHHVLDMIERNTLHGRHFAMSETNVGLLMKLRTGLNAINKAAGCADTDFESRNSEMHEKQVVEDGLDSPQVDVTLLEICKHLEDENRNLKKKQEDIDSELRKFQSKASKTSLIPHYRNAVVKVRNQCEKLNSELRDCKNELLKCESKLEFKSLETQKHEKKFFKLESLYCQVREERDKYKEAIFDIIQDVNKGVRIRSREKLGTEAIPRKYKFRHKVPGANGDNNIDKKTESLADQELAMKENIRILDGEIETLRQRLEAVTSSRAHDVIADVIHQATQHVH